MGGNMNKARLLESIEAEKHLKTLLNEGDTLYTIVKKVSPSGMSRQIITLIRTESGIRNISWLVATAQGYRRNHSDRNWFTISGCGMDMGAAITFDLSFLLFKDEYKLKHAWL
jgi:hypothetical protein